jgi:protein-S-isoprenylcysteine O-methyltransferase Ste14
MSSASAAVAAFGDENASRSFLAATQCTGMPRRPKPPTPRQSVDLGVPGHAARKTTAPGSLAIFDVPLQPPSGNASRAPAVERLGDAPRDAALVGNLTISGLGVASAHLREGDPKSIRLVARPGGYGSNGNGGSPGRTPHSAARPRTDLPGWRFYAIGFVGGFGSPEDDRSPGGDGRHALLVNLVLLGLFAIQHSVMARPVRCGGRFVRSQIERSTRCAPASLILLLLYWQWRPMTSVIWDVQAPAGALLLRALSGLGWLTVLFGTFLINHFDLFGLRQVYLHLRSTEYTALPFRTPVLYNFVRHPIMLGFILAFWSTPRMTAGHLLFAIMTTGYILIAIQRGAGPGGPPRRALQALSEAVSMTVPIREE